MNRRDRSQGALGALRIALVVLLAACGSDSGENLAAVAARAKQLGLQLDMTLGESWPWATPDTTGDLSQQELMYGRVDVTGRRRTRPRSRPRSATRRRLARGSR